MLHRRTLHSVSIDSRYFHGSQHELTTSACSTECGHSFCAECLARHFEFDLVTKLKDMEHLPTLRPYFTQGVRLPNSAAELHALASSMRTCLIDPANIFSYSCPLCRFLLNFQPVSSPQYEQFNSQMMLLLRIKRSGMDLDVVPPSFDTLFLAQQDT